MVAAPSAPATWGRTPLVGSGVARHHWTVYRWLERVLVSRILRRSRLAQALFKVPKWLYRTPLRRAMEPHVLLLTTSGRRSGDPHTVAVEYLTIDEAD